MARWVREYGGANDLLPPVKFDRQFDTCLRRAVQSDSKTETPVRTAQWTVNPDVRLLGVGCIRAGGPRDPSKMGTRHRMALEVEKTHHESLPTLLVGCGDSPCGGVVVETGAG